MQLLNDSSSPEDFYQKTVNGGMTSPPFPPPPIPTTSVQHSNVGQNQAKVQLTHNHLPSPSLGLKHPFSPMSSQHLPNQSGHPSCYLCTVTCCDTVNCSKSAPILAPSGRFLHRANSDMQAKQSCIDSVIQQQQIQQQPHQHRPASVASLRQCPICIETPHSPLPTYRATPPFLFYPNSPTPPIPQHGSHRQTPPISSPTPKVKVQTMIGSGNVSPRALSRTDSSPIARKTSFREKPKLHIFIPENGNRNIPSPDYSSGSPSGGGGCGSGSAMTGCGMGGGGGSSTAMYSMRHSSFTDYTDTCTPPLCSSTTPGSGGAAQMSGLSNSDCIPDFPSSNSSTRKVALLTDVDYQQLYLTGRGAEKHGFFRKAVPALPIVVAVLFCIFNLILPGSGTLLASLTIILGSQTEYGPGHGCRSFFICFLSAILQFTTAIFVFGWVWSIMWGIVFIKNSLRYGDKRDINTITLC